MKFKNSSLKGRTYLEIYGSEEETKKQIEKRVLKTKQALKDNPEIVKNQAKKRLQTLKDNPEIMLNSTKKMMQTRRDNPNIRIQRVKKYKQTYKNNPEIQKNSNKKHKQTLKDNPEIQKNSNKKHKQTLKDNPEIHENIIKKFKKTLKDNPEIMEQQAKKSSATKQGVNMENWNGFIYCEPYDQNWTPKFRRAVRKRDNQVCMLCGIHREKLYRALDVHHINGDKKMSILQNGISLCQHCHIGIVHKDDKNKEEKENWIKLFQDKLTRLYNYQYENGDIILKLQNEQTS